jgi:RNA-binding protein 5/10
MRGLAPDSTHEEIRDRIGAEIVRLASSTHGEHGAPSTTIADGRQVIERVILIRNKYTKLCAGFGFIELATPALATALLAHLLSRTAQPVGFVINGRPVACSFANMQAFAPVGPEGVGEAWCFPCLANAKPGGIGGQAAGGWCKYWDDTCGASLLDVSPELGTEGHAEQIAREPALERFLHALDSAADPSQGPGKDEPHALGSGSGSGSRSGTPLAAGGIGAIKLLPLRVGAKKNKEADAMVALPVAGADRQNTSGASHCVFTVDDRLGRLLNSLCHAWFQRP